MAKEYSFKINLKQAVAFAILMENNDGIIHKAPKYILEKLARLEYRNNPEELLDQANLAKYNAWIDSWIKKFEKKEENAGPELPGI